MSLIARVRGLPKLSTGITHYVNHGYTSPVHSCAVKYFQRASSRRLSTNLFISNYKTNRLFTGAAFCGTLGVASYVYFEYLNDSSVHCEDAASQQEQSDDKISSIKYKLYQYETCPFCCKVRAFFDYYGIEYEKVEVNPLFRRELKAITDYRKVPVLVAGESQVSILDNIDFKRLLFMIYGMSTPEKYHYSELYFSDFLSLCIGKPVCTSHVHFRTNVPLLVLN